MEVLYSQTRHPLEVGRQRVNPRFFADVPDGATKALIIGDWPKIVEAYAAAGIPAERVDAPDAAAPPIAAPAALTPVAPDYSAVVIPDDWADLNYNRPAPDRDITQRAIAAQLSPEPILNKAQAIEAIEAEIARRAAPPTAANGLTRTEIDADLEGMGIEPDPTMSLEDATVLRDLARAERDANNG